MPLVSINLKRSWVSFEILISIAVFFLLLIFTYGFISAPYSGLYINPTTGILLDIYIAYKTGESLELGDQIYQVGDITLESYRKDRTIVLFENLEVGQSVDITINRNGKTFLVEWIYPGFNAPEFYSRLVNVWWLGYFFWLFGFLTQILIYDPSQRDNNLTAIFYLTAIWLVAGSSSGFHVFGSSLILHTITWLLVPTYLKFHWDFPKPLGTVSKLFWMILYLFFIILAALELLQLLPRSLYALGFLAALIGSLFICFVRYFEQPAQRQELSFLFSAFTIALLPAIIAVVLVFTGVPQFNSLPLLSLPIIPSAYFYAVYRNRLGEIVSRAARIFSVYSFLIVIGSILQIVIRLFYFSNISASEMYFFAFILSMLTALLTILIFPPYQKILERRLHEKLPNLLELYKLRVFLCHSSEDKEMVRKVYRRLRLENWLDPWLDEDKLLPGQDWNAEIERVVETSEAVIVCLSNNSINKEGYVQKEIRKVLDVSDQKPDGTIFLIPLRLELCEVPTKLSKWQWVNYFDAGAYEKILKSLRIRLQSVQKNLS